ncbi:MAG: hypothetical protein U9Q69_04980 [Nanoarchaeota archaeon]|nr:hypothetical protein [Nanoarchaeota archaeon]
MAKKKTVKIQKKKKAWYNVIAPPEFKNENLGMTPASNPETLAGRILKVNMVVLTRNMKKQSFSIFFRIKDVRGLDAHTEVIQYRMNNIHVKRIVKKGKDKIDASFIVKTKDDANVRIKPILLTRNKVQNSVLTSLRKAAEKMIVIEAKKMDYPMLINMIIDGTLQKQLKKSLKKIYPLSIVDIRMFKKL